MASADFPLEENTIAQAAVAHHLWRHKNILWMRDVIAGLLPQIAKSLGRDFEEPAARFRGASGNKRLATVATVAAVILTTRGAWWVVAACGTLVIGISTLTRSASAVRRACVRWGRAFSLAVFPTVAAATAAFTWVFVKARVAGWPLGGSSVRGAGRALVLLLGMARMRRAGVWMTRRLFGVALIGAVLTRARGA